MASELRVNTLKDAAGNNSIAMTYVANGSAKATVSYDGQGNSIRSSFNTSSVSDEATGRYYWNNSSAFSNTTTGILSGATHRTSMQSLCGISGSVQRSTTQWDLNTVNNSAASADVEVGALGTGDLA